LKGLPMNRLAFLGFILFSGLSSTELLAEKGPRSPKEALQVFNELIGPWKGTGQPAGSLEEKQKGFWVEKIAWQWQFKGNDAWLVVDFKKSKNFLSGELRFLPDKDLYQLTMKTLDKKTQVYTGKMVKRALAVERQEAGEGQRLVITMLHPNRYLYRYEVRPKGKPLYRQRYNVGVTREGVSFVEGSGQPECIVSGGLGTIPVTYNGQKYYVCCSGCRDEFNANPQKYIKEYEAKKAKKGK
jgi:hypothetical protein